MKTMRKLFLLLFIVPLYISYTSSYCQPGYDARDVTFEDIFLRADLNSTEEIDSLNRKCRELNLALSFERHHNERVAYLTIRGVKIYIPQSILENVYSLLSQENTYNNTKAYVRVCDETTSMGYDEKKFVTQRLGICKPAIEKLIGKTITQKQTPRIALCCSGGGVRAALSTAGLLKGFDETNVSNIFLYNVGLSGSTWTIGSYMYSSDSFSTFYSAFIKRITNGFIHTTPEISLSNLKNALPTLADYLLKKLVFNEVPSVIDIYGYCLALTLLDPVLKDHYLTVDLADQKAFIQNGQRPYPLYTAVVPCDDNENYSWISFSPDEIAILDRYAAVPTWSWGREFQKGASVTFAPPITGGFLFGLWGSAISTSCEEFAKLVIGSLEPKIIFGPLKQLLESSIIQDVRLFPAQIRNITYQLPQFPYNQEQRTTCVDAGIHFNIPLPPLLTHDRHIDIIIICDASGDVLGAPELHLAEKWAAQNEIPFPKIDYNGITTRSYTIFDDGEHSKAPIIIYVPMVYNAQYSTAFDPQDFLGFGKFLHTFNFKYTEQQANLLTGLFRQAARELKTDLIKTIQKVVDRKA